MKKLTLLALCLMWTVASFAQNALFYKSEDGSGAIIGVGADHSLSVAKEMNDATIGKDWTHIVHIGGKLMFYNANTGAAAIGTATANDIKINNTFDVGKLPTGYTHLISLGSTRVLCYNAKDGSGSVGNITGTNDYKNLKSFNAGGLPKGFTHLTAINTNAGGTKILFYNTNDGSGGIGAISSDGEPQMLKTYAAGKFTKGWTGIVSVEGKIIYYNSVNGSAVLGMLPPNNELQTVKTYQPDSFPLNFSHLVNVGGKILYYNANDGGAAIGVVTSSEHIFAKQFPSAAIKPGYTHVTKGAVTIK